MEWHFGVLNAQIRFVFENNIPTVSRSVYIQWSPHFSGTPMFSPFLWVKSWFCSRCSLHPLKKTLAQIPMGKSSNFLKMNSPSSVKSPRGLVLVHLFESPQERWRGAAGANLAPLRKRWRRLTFEIPTVPWNNLGLPSGKLTYSYWTWPIYSVVSH